MEKLESTDAEKAQLWLEGFCRRAEDRGVESVEDKRTLMDLFFEAEPDGKQSNEK